MAAVLAGAGLLFLGPRPTACASEQSDRARIIARFEKLQNMSVAFSERYEDREKPQIGILEKEGSFSFLRGAARYEDRFTDATVKQVERLELPAALRYWVRTYTAQRSGDLREFPVYDRTVQPTRVTWKASATIAHARFDEAGIMDVALGLRPMHPGGPNNVAKWITPERLNRMRFRAVDDDHIELEEDQVWSDHAVYRWLLSRKLGYAVTRCALVDNEQKHDWDVVAADDFRDVGGVMVPFKVTYTEYSQEYTSRKWVPPTVSVLAVTGYKIGDPANTPARYAIAWPKKGMTVEVYMERDGRTVEGVVRTDRDGQVLDTATLERKFEPKKD